MQDPNELSEPRSYLATAIRFGSLFGLLMGLFFTWLDANVRHTSFIKALPFGFVGGAIGALIFGSIMGWVMRVETQIIPISDRKLFVSSVNVAAAQIGYHPRGSSEGLLTYSPSWQVGVLAGRLSIQIRGQDAVIVGPRVYVRRLLVRLRNEL